MDGRSRTHRVPAVEGPSGPQRRVAPAECAVVFKPGPRPLPRVHRSTQMQPRRAVAQCRSDAAPPRQPSDREGLPHRCPPSPTVQIGPGPGTGRAVRWRPSICTRQRPRASVRVRCRWKLAPPRRRGVRRCRRSPDRLACSARRGKIVEGIANVGASFLVGTLTNGTTENPYGVTQRGTNPTGGTKLWTTPPCGDVYHARPRCFQPAGPARSPEVPGHAGWI